MKRTTQASTYNGGYRVTATITFTHQDYSASDWTLDQVRAFVKTLGNGFNFTANRADTNDDGYEARINVTKSYLNDHDLATARVEVQELSKVLADKYLDYLVRYAELNDKEPIPF